MAAEGARVLRLQPDPERHYEACPRWCRGHDDGPEGRRHAGPRTMVPARLADTGRMADVALSVELRDDGQGGTREVFVLDAGGPVELTVAGMHQMLKEAERVFWKVDARGDFIGWHPEPAARPERVSVEPTPMEPRGIQNRGGRG